MDDVSGKTREKVPGESAGELRGTSSFSLNIAYFTASCTVLFKIFLEFLNSDSYLLSQPL